MSGRSLFRPHLVFSARRDAQADETARDQAEQFRLVMLPHMDAAYSLARYLTRDATAAEDVVQDAFLRAYRGFDGWRGDNAKAWLLTIVRNCFLNSVGSNRAVAMTEADMVALADPADSQDPETIVAGRREAAMLRHTIEQLPEPFREAIVLREMEELAYKDIAAITNVPIGTVMSRLARARQMLGQMLMPEPGASREARS